MVSTGAVKWNHYSFGIGGGGGGVHIRDGLVTSLGLGIVGHNVHVYGMIVFWIGVIFDAGRLFTPLRLWGLWYVVGVTS